jgi:hypothetical protein
VKFNPSFGICLGAFALCCATQSKPASAGFFIPADVWMAMTTLSPTERNVALAYGFNRNISGSLEWIAVKESDATIGRADQTPRWRNLAMVQGAYLMKRLVVDDGIGNAYVFGGPFLQKRDQADAKLGVAAGVWLDFETRRVYSRLKAHSFRSEAWRRNEVVGQLMWAPYAADYDDIAAWGGVQLKRVSGEKQTEVTPYVRFFQKTWWIDAGVSVNRNNRNDFFLNLMHTF